MARFGDQPTPRNRFLIQSLLIGVRSCGPVERILLVSDGLSSHLSQALHVFREPLSTSKVGRIRLVLAAGVMIARAKTVLCWSRIGELGSTEIGSLGPINTLPLDHKSGSPESLLGLHPASTDHR